jgi:hypothetical protein
MMFLLLVLVYFMLSLSSALTMGPLLKQCAEAQLVPL